MSSATDLFSSVGSTALDAGGDTEGVAADEVGSNSLIFGGAYPAHLILDLIHLDFVRIECDECLGFTHLWQYGLLSSHFIRRRPK